MTLSIKLTSEMTAEEMTPLWPDIMRCFETYCSRFKDDETVENMLSQCSNGRRQLWIIQDESGRVILAPITEIVKIDATGALRFVCAEIGGERLQEAMPLLSEMERWAAEEKGCTEFELIGRKGWQRLLAPFEYEFAASIYRKTLRSSFTEVQSAE